MPTSKKRDNCKMGGNMRLSTREIDASIIIVSFRWSSWPTTRRAAERRGMMRYCRVLVVRRTWPGMSLSLVKMHILILFPTCLLVTCLINSDPFSCTYTSLFHTSVQFFHLHHSSLCRADINRSLHLLVVQSWFVCLHCCVNPLLLSELSPTIGQTCGLSWLPSFFSSVSQQTTIFTSSHLQPPKNYNGTFWQA